MDAIHTSKGLNILNRRRCPNDGIFSHRDECADLERGSEGSAALQLEKSEEILDDPVRC